MKTSRYIKVMCLLLGLSIFVFGGCVKREGNRNTDSKETTTEETTTETNKRYNAQDIVVVTDIDTEKSQISVKSIQNNGKIYVLNYTSGTSIKNKYDTEVLISKIGIGEIVDVYYVAGTQKLIAIQESNAAWENDSVTNWDMDYDKMLMTIGEDNYQYDGNLFIKSGKKIIDIKNISGVDKLVVRGIDNKIYSIYVEKGHGYVRLTDTTNMIGGIVDIGGKIITVITEDMVIAAPEGEYDLTASKNGKGGSVKIKVERDDEVTVSLSGFNGEIEKNGAVKLNILPEGVSYNVFVDGKEVDISEVVDLPYGVHRLKVTSDKYTDYTEEITISSIYMNKTIDLSTGEEVKNDGEETTANSETETTGESTTTAAGDNQVTITKPEGASVYVDGIFKGTIPFTMTKVPGTHSFILRQTGYESVTYTVEFSDDTKSVSLVFPAMETSETATE